MSTEKQHPAANAPQLPAIDANLFNGDVAPNKVRITFAQQWHQNYAPSWFSAVSMNLADATSLRDLLDLLIQKAEAMTQPK
jgi:hypothetical protein